MNMPNQNISIENIIENQRNYFNKGVTKDLNFRKVQLKKLQQAIKDNENEIFDALNKDLHRPSFEAYISETAVLDLEIEHTLKNLKKWNKPQKVSMPIGHFKSSGMTKPEPLGTVLIISPWNYPFQLAIAPLIPALAGGNCVVIKPSELAPYTSKVIAKIISDNFDRRYIAVVEGSVDETQALLREKFDHIFFTGGSRVGKIIMEAASKHLTPVTLELGGKSPCIVDKDANISVAAHRIAWGKSINAGQTCIAPDYLFVHEDIKDKLSVELKKVFHKFYGENIQGSPDYCRIINKDRFRHLAEFLNNGNIIIGGETDEENLYIAPTVLDNVKFSDPVMQEEIFGPILPMITFNSIHDVVKFINKNPIPLALYYFSEDKKKQDFIIDNTSSGGVTINDTIIHVSVNELPFGGVGNSGIGKYHGKSGFNTFSHSKSVLTHSTIFDSMLRYPPYGNKLLWFRKVFKYVFS